MKQNSHLGKSFETQLKSTVKQIKAFKEHGKRLEESNKLIRKYDSDTENDSPNILKQREIINDPVDKR